MLQSLRVFCMAIHMGPSTKQQITKKKSSNKFDKKSCLQILYFASEVALINLAKRVSTPHLVAI